jgi:hypothetical protein
MKFFKNSRKKEAGAVLSETVIALPIILTIGFFASGIVDFAKDKEQTYNETRQSIISTYRRCALSEDWTACSKKATKFTSSLPSIKGTLYEATAKGLESLSNGDILPISSIIPTTQTLNLGSRVLVMEDEHDSQFGGFLSYSGHSNTLKHSAVIWGATSAWGNESRGFNTENQGTTQYASGLSNLEMWDMSTGTYLGNLANGNNVSLANKRINFKPVLKSTAKSSTVYIDGIPYPIMSSGGYAYSTKGSPILKKGNHKIRVISYSKPDLRGLFAHEDIGFRVR